MTDGLNSGTIEITDEQLDMVFGTNGIDFDPSTINLDITNIKKSFNRSTEEMENYLNGLEVIMDDSYSLFKEAKDSLIKVYNERAEREVKLLQRMIAQEKNIPIEDRQISDNTVDEYINGLVELRESIERKIAFLGRAYYNIIGAYLKTYDLKESKKNAETAVQRLESLTKEFCTQTKNVDLKKVKNITSEDEKLLTQEEKNYKKASSILEKLGKLVEYKTEKENIPLEEFEKLEKSIERQTKSFSSMKTLISNIDARLNELYESANSSLDKLSNPLKKLEIKSGIEKFKEPVSQKAYKQGQRNTQQQIEEYLKRLYMKGALIKVNSKGKIIISNKYKKEVNAKALAEMEKYLVDLPNAIISKLNAEFARESRNKRIQYGTLDIKEAKPASARLADVNRTSALKTRIRPKSIIPFLTDIDKKRMAYYQTLISVKCSNKKLSKTAKEKRAAKLAATYFQNLVSNTPIDEPYKYTIQVDEADRKEISVSFTDNSEKMLSEALQGIERKSHEYQISHTPDKDCARGDWVLHYRGFDFKAFDTKRGTGEFSEEDFKNKGDDKSIARIAAVLYDKTKTVENTFYSFNVSNDNPHVKYLEYGGYLHDTEAKIGSKYGFEHGVKDKHTYQAPHGFLRLVNATWNYLATKSDKSDAALLRKGNFKIDASKIDLDAVNALLQKGGMPTADEIDKVYTREAK